MKKTRDTIVAAAALLGCGLGWAQSSVQLYGIMDLGLAYANHVRTGAVGSPTGTRMGIDSGQASTSRLGFRGREDLGGGLSALFVLEGGLNGDAGTYTSGGRPFGRQSYVALAGKFGELQLGREVLPFYDFGVVFDPVAPARFGGPIFDAAYVGRADNAIKHIGKFGGLTVRTQYSFGYDSTIANGGELPQFRVGKEGGIFADYLWNALNAGVTFDRQNGTSVATQQDKNQRLAFGASYDFSAFKLYAAYERQIVRTAAVSNVNKLYWVGARISPMQGVTITPGVYLYDPAGASNRSLLPTVAAYYDLSKRTDVYAQVGYMKNQSNATIALSGPINPGDNQTGFTVGIRHRF
jgi:predicted porin